MSVRQYINTMPDALARNNVRLHHEYGDRGVSTGMSVAEMEARGVLNALSLLYRHRVSVSAPFGSLHSWVMVAAEIAAVIYPNPSVQRVEAVCARIGLPIDPHLVNVSARRIAVARAADGALFRMMDGEAVGKAVQLTAEERTNLGITKIGSVDETPEERAKRLNKERQTRHRRTRGIKPRASSLKPVSKPKKTQKLVSELSKEGTDVTVSVYKGERYVHNENDGKRDAQQHHKRYVQRPNDSPSGKRYAEPPEAIRDASQDCLAQCDMEDDEHEKSA